MSVVGRIVLSVSDVTCLVSTVSSLLHSWRVAHLQDLDLDLDLFAAARQVVELWRPYAPVVGPNNPMMTQASYGRPTQPPGRESTLPLPPSALVVGTRYLHLFCAALSALSGLTCRCSTNTALRWIVNGVVLNSTLRWSSRQSLSIEFRAKAPPILALGERLRSGNYVTVERSASITHAYRS